MLEQGLCPLYPGSSHPSSSKPFTSILFIPELLVPLTLPPGKAASGLSPPALGAHLPWLAPSLRAALSSLLSSPGTAPNPLSPFPAGASCVLLAPHSAPSPAFHSAGFTTVTRLKAQAPPSHSPMDSLPDARAATPDSHRPQRRTRGLTDSSPCKQ